MDIGGPDKKIEELVEAIVHQKQQADQFKIIGNR